MIEDTDKSDMMAAALKRIDDELKKPERNRIEREAKKLSDDIHNQCKWFECEGFNHD